MVAPVTGCTPGPLNWGLDWAIHGGLLSWVTSIPHGRILIREGATLTRTNRFHFPYVAHQDLPEAPGDRLHFAGEVCMQSPTVQWKLSIRNLTVDIDSDADTAVMHTELPQGRLELARMSLPPAQVAMPQTVIWRDAAMVLAEPAVATFGGAYAAASSLAPITLTIPLDAGLHG